MPRGFHIGRIFDIDINIDASWFLIFLLITWNLVFGIFPAIHPQWSFLLNLVVGLGASLLFFASVLAHELAHSLVAKARDIHVSQITLFLFGGVSNIEKEPPSPGTEFFMAIVGPLTSIILGAIFLLLGGATIGSWTAVWTNPETVLPRLDPLGTLLVWLGPINILVGLFNLIPGFPLDGGRVLRSILWVILNNLRQATFYASRVGQAVAWLFILTGISMIFGINIPILGSGIIGGLWLIFIGWFLNNAAALSYQQVINEDVLGKVAVSRLVRTNVPTVGPQTTISDLVYNYIFGTDRRSFPVMEADKFVGLVSIEDISKVPKDEWEEKNIREIMTPAEELVAVSPKENAAEALRKLVDRDVGQLPVIQDGKFVGMLNRRDILLWLQLREGYPAS